ncbi:dihydrolipoamide acetyltransferase family protein [Nitrincola alkalilacustris]|uniref:dihydrolipoamide acetyltransferase family protein n=1 Tax=Nitrincola alkalilacustris TaxID=1571224 RepID=UPI00124D76A2|nr:dihydrolipoamide acetyltransferase family protein [Nitrincola alkalilacustris]
MKYFKLPDLGEGLPEAEIIEWHVKEGDEVKTDQILVVVETAKAIIEVPSPCDGTISHLFGAEGDTIHTGEPLVEFVDSGDSDSGTVVGELKRSSTPDSQEEHFIIGSAHGSQPARSNGQIRATPAVRALAQRLGVSLNTLRGTGSGNSITPEDVERAAERDKTLGAPELLRGVRKQMARTMAQAHAEVVAVTLCEDADINHWPKGTDINMRLVQAIAAACKAEPALNAWFDGQQLARRMNEKIDLGVAVDTEAGLFVPVLRNIGERTPEDLREGLDRLRADVLARSIPPQEMQGATITLSNFGTICGRYASPIVVPPQVAIIGAGVIRQQAMVVQEEIVPRRIMPLSLTFDHRAATGGEAARFMQALIRTLQEHN